MALPTELTGNDEEVTRAWLNQLRSEVATLQAAVNALGSADALVATAGTPLRITTATGVKVTLVAGGTWAGGTGLPGFYVKFGDHTSIDTTDRNDFDGYWAIGDKRNAPLTA